MEEVFWIGLAILLVGSILAFPIATFVICMGLRKRQKQQAQEMADLRQGVYSRLDGLVAAAPRAAGPKTPPPVAAKTVEQVTPVVAPATEAQHEPDKSAVTAASGRVAAKTVTTPTVAVTKPAAAPVQAPPPPRLPVTAKVREPNQFELAARKIIKGIWSWIIVGEEHRKEGVSVEFAVATNWLVRVGVLVVVVGIGYFLSYSSTRGWLQPLGKVSLSLLVGSGLIAGGIHLLGKRYHIIAQGLLGAGLAVMYASIFAASNRYSLIGMGTSFALMTCVTAGAAFMSVRFGSMLIAILGIIGGYGTPIMLSTGSANFIGLYSYMLLLGVGVLGIAHRRNWHLLNFLAFAATYGLIAASLHRYFQPDRFWHVMPFLIAFFALFSTVIFIYQVVNRQKATLLELIMLVLNAGFFFGISYLLIKESYTTEWCSAVALGLAAFYTGHIYLFMTRKGRDRGLVLGFISLAAFFLIVTVPLVLSDQWLTLCWSVQALVMLWLAGKMNSRFLQYVAYGLYAIVFGRFFCLDLYGQFSIAIPQEATLGTYLGMLTERLISFGVPVASAACAMRLLQRPISAAPLKLDPSNDVKELVRKQWALVAVGVFVFSMLFVYLHLELNRTMMFIWNPLRLPVLSTLWVAACLLFLTLYVVLESKALFILFMLFVAGTLVKLISVDFRAWHTSFHLYRYLAPGGYSFMDAGMRLVDYGVILAFFVYAFNLLRRRSDARSVSLFFGYGSIVLLLVYTTFELNSFLAHFVPGLRSGGISVFWSIFALALVTGGLAKAVRPLRFAGLVLFAVVAVKVFLYDLGHLDPIYRIVAFTLLGIVLLAGAFVYLKFQDRFSALLDTDRKGEGTAHE